MKKNTYTLIACLSFLSILFASCSSVKQTAFNERKYTNFRHHDPVVVLNKYKQHQTETVAVTIPSKNVNTIAVTQETPVPVTSPVMSLPVLHKNNVKRSAKNSITLTTAANTIPTYNPEEFAPYYPVPVPAPEATASGGSGVSQTVIIILAIFLSPLGVYLYDNAATTRFWIDLVLWAVGVGFFGIVIFLGILWLVAVIYALLIVLGHA